MKNFTMMVLVVVLMLVGNLFAIEGSFDPISDEVLDSKPMRAWYHPFSKVWVESIVTLGRPVAEAWAYFAFEGVGITTSLVSGELGVKVAKDALFKVAESYVSASPKDVCKELASSMMDTGLAAYRRNYPKYRAWRKGMKMSRSERVVFRKDNYTSNYLGFGKDLWTDVMNYKYKKGKYSSGATKKYLLEEIASLKGSASTTVEILDKLKRIVGLARSESLANYPPYNEHLKRIRKFEDREGVKFSLARREEVGPDRKRSGEVTLRDCDVALEAFSFGEGRVLSLQDFDLEGLGESELMEKMLSMDLLFDIPQGFITNNKRYRDEGFLGSGGIIDMGRVSLGEVSEAPKSNYRIGVTSDDIKEGHTYCVRTANGKNYAKIEVLELEIGHEYRDDGFVRFLWEYQPRENVRSFGVVESKSAGRRQVKAPKKKASRVIRDGLVAHYKLDAVSGVVVDSVSGNDGLNLGATRGIDGVDGSAFEFDGINDYVHNNNRWSDVKTFSFWFKTEGNTARHIMGARTSSSSNKIGLGVNLIKISRWPKGRLSYAVDYTNGEFVHVVYVNEGNAGKAHLYVNGVLRDSGAGYSLPTHSGCNVLLGAYSNEGALSYFDGALDDVRIYNRALLASEVLKLYEDVR